MTSDELFDLFLRSRESFRDESLYVNRLENNEPLVYRSEIESAGFVCDPYWETGGDTEGDCYRNYIDSHSSFDLAMRRGVFERLIQARKHMPDSWSLVVKAGYRPLAVQHAVLEAFVELSRNTHPNWSESQHQAHAREYVSDPDEVCPPHCTGGAIDIDAIHKISKQPVDFGCPPNTDAPIAHIFNDELNQTQINNRQILLGAMLKSGFAPLANEWWHFQYGETYWAAFYGKKETIYDTLPDA